MTDTDITELLEYVRAAAPASKAVTRGQKTALLRQHRWRRVKSGKSERWESPDGRFVGSVNECYKRAMAQERRRQ